jgi:hypothetical protein
LDRRTYNVFHSSHTIQGPDCTWVTPEKESLKLARTEMQRQLEVATHPARKQQLAQALTEIEKRIKELSA